MAKRDGSGPQSKPAIPTITITCTDDETDNVGVGVELPVVVPVQAIERRDTAGENLEELDEVRVILKRLSKSISQVSGESEGKTPSTSAITGGRTPGGSSHDRQRKQKEGSKRKRRTNAIKWRWQLYTIFWTNLLMRYRMKVVSLFELLLPVLIIWICIAALTSTHHWAALHRTKQDLSDPKNKAAAHTPKRAISEAQIQAYFCKSGRLCTHRKVYLVYTPETDFTRQLMQNVSVKLLGSGREFDTLLGVDSVEELVTLCRNQYDKSASDPEVPDPVGIVFSVDKIHSAAAGMEFTPAGYPTVLTYTIRTFISEISNTLDLFPYLDIPNDDGISPYITTGFVGLQSAIDTTYTEMLAEEMGEVPLADLTIAKPSLLVHLSKDTRLQMFPFTIYLDLKVRHSTWAVIMLSIILGYFCTTYFTLNRLILHRSAGILKMLKLHGMSSTLHWLSLLFYEIIFHCITCIGVTCILFVHVTVQGGLLEYDNPVLVFFFLYVHGLAANCFCLLISSFFTKVALGSMIGYLISFLSYFIPLNLFLYGYLHHSLLNLFLCLLFPNWTLANGLYQLLKFESYDSGVDWSSSTTWTDDGHILFPIGWCLLIFLTSSFLYFGLTLISDHSANLKSFCNNCCCQCRCVFCKCKKKKINHQSPEAGGNMQIQNGTRGEETFDKPDVYEGDTHNPCHVKLRNVTVIFNNDTIALDDVSMNFHEGKITVLLGYNHAGKSTLLSVVAGLTTPTSGSIHVHGKDPFTSSNRLSKKIGFCPRKLSLFPSLSVEEHIRLCCMLHGNSIRNSKATTAALLKTFKLWEARRMGVKYISASQLRKLGLAMAMSNNCSVLVLEEPTYQMSDAERHDVWSSLQCLKKNRTVIVSLGSLDDGDAYADRLVLMSKGKIVCAGTPSFLSQAYNIGTFVKVHKAVEEVNVDQITFFIQILFPGLAAAGELHEVKLTGNEEQEHYMYLSIPRSLKFSTVLNTLESFKDELGIADVRVLHNTLAGIFYKLGTSTAGSAAPNYDQIGIFRKKRESTDFTDKLLSGAGVGAGIELPDLPKGVQPSPTSCQRLQGLIIRHFQYAHQKHWHFFGEFAVSFILIAVFMYFCETYLHPQPESSARLLTFNTYPESVVPVRLKIVPQYEAAAWMNAFRHVAGSGVETRRLRFYNTSTQDANAFFAHQQPSDRSRTSYQAQISTAFDVSFTHDNNIGYYASNARHAAPIALNTFKNVILYLLTPATLRDVGNSYRVTTFNHPFVTHSGTGSPTGTVHDVTNALAGVLFSFVLALIAASRLTLPHLERRSGLKYLLRMAGVSGFEYWTATWICDLLLGLVGSLCLLAIVWVTDAIGVFAGWETKALIFMLCALYLCWSSLPFAYIFSFVISNSFSGYGQFVMFHILTGSLPILVTYLIYEPGAGSNSQSGYLYYIRYIFQIFPSFTVSSAFVLLCEQVAQRHFCNRVPSESKSVCHAYEGSLHFGPGSNAHYQHYALPNGSASLLQNDVYFQKCCKAFCEPDNSCLHPPPILAHEPGAFDIWLNLIFMVAQGVGYWILLAVVSLNVWTRVLDWVRHCRRRHTTASAAAATADLESMTAMTLHVHAQRHSKRHAARNRSKKKDSDVQQEENRVTNALDTGLMATDCLIVSDLTREHGFRKLLDHVCFKMFAGTILGLLGPDGCGKAEVIQALTGKLRYTHGSMILNRTPMDHHKRKFLRQIGYSPDKPALLAYLTGLQMMELMGRIRGLPRQHLTIHAKKWLTLLGFSAATQALKCRYYNNGRQKRLSFGLAMIGSPYLLLLDEPTDPLDDNESLLMWNLLTFLRKQGQSILFTSSNAEECLQICTKLITMLNGAVSSVGTPQHIFSKYPRGWSLMIRLYHDIGVKFAQPDVDRMTESLVSYVLRAFRPCELTDQREHLLFFYINELKAKPKQETEAEEQASVSTNADSEFALDFGREKESETRTLSAMYGLMEQIKEGMPDFIDEYFIEEASLDDALTAPPPTTQDARPKT